MPKRERTRAKLLEAARSLIRENGYEHTTLAAIAALHWSHASMETLGDLYRLRRRVRGLRCRHALDFAAGLAEGTRNASYACRDLLRSSRPGPA